jgi:alpha/beta superfamily hydrolase
MSTPTTPTFQAGSIATANPELINLAGPAGRIAMLMDRPEIEAVGIALLAHPQPLMGGTPRHKIPHRLARTVRALGWIVLRPFFRGVGTTEGHYDHGIGESEDMLAVIAFIRDRHPTLPLVLIGFSFGAYVLSKVASTLAEQNCGAQKVILAGLPVGTVPVGRTYDTGPVPADTLIIHGEYDTHAPLASLLDWARPQHLPVVVFPGADHFFSGNLDRFSAVVANALSTRRI